ncbi:MAG: hypothetical protein KDA91_15575 [Planctomycetaceae bacterium]|nr:hypothetical protein [Planctomycetaceae bacterium]
MKGTRLTSGQFLTTVCALTFGLGVLLYAFLPGADDSTPEFERADTAKLRTSLLAGSGIATSFGRNQSGDSVSTESTGRLTQAVLPLVVDEAELERMLSRNPFVLPATVEKAMSENAMSGRTAADQTAYGKMPVLFDGRIVYEGSQIDDDWIAAVVTPEKMILQRVVQIENTAENTETNSIR